MDRASLCFLRERQQRRPVGIPDNPVHEVEIHEAEARHRGAQVKVDDVLLADPPQGLAVAHPGQSIHYLLITRQLDAKPVT